MNQLAQFRDDLLQMDTAAGVASEPGPAARTLLDGALNYCAGKMSLIGPQSALDNLRAGQPAAHSYFQFALARQAAVYMAGLDGEVTAAYLYDYEATPEDIIFGKLDPTPIVHIIVRVRRRTEALQALGDALNQALARVYAERTGQPVGPQMLDLQYVDDAETRQGRGYASLLSAFNLRPLLVWER